MRVWILGTGILGCCAVAMTTTTRLPYVESDMYPFHRYCLYHHQTPNASAETPVGTLSGYIFFRHRHGRFHPQISVEDIVSSWAHRDKPVNCWFLGSRAMPETRAKAVADWTKSFAISRESMDSRCCWRSKPVDVLLVVSDSFWLEDRKRCCYLYQWTQCGLFLSFTTNCSCLLVLLWAPMILLLSAGGASWLALVVLLLVLVVLLIQCLESILNFIRLLERRFSVLASDLSEGLLCCWDSTVPC